MGVPRLFPWLTITFPGITITLKRGQSGVEVDNVYIDSQSIAHAACQFAFNYGAKKRRMYPFEKLSYVEKRLKAFEFHFNTIKSIVKLVRPRRLLYISNDGPAPIAKQSQQRQRRFASEPSSGFDSNSLTPGTEFMAELTEYMEFAIRREIQTNEAWKKFRVIFSGSNEEGEGEHKLLNYIRAMPKEQAQRESHCIVGPDGDLIMLALAAHVDNIFLLREDIESVDVYHFVDMGRVRRELPSIFPATSGPRSLDDVSNDFIFIGFLVGNDFLPKVQMFMYLEEGLQLMIKEYIDVYTSSGMYLTTDGKINREAFRRFIERLSENEKMYLEQQAPYSRNILAVTQGMKPEEIEARFSGYEREKNNPIFVDHTLLDNMEGDTLNFDTYATAYYSRAGIDISGTSRDLDRMCRDYIKTIIWIGEYYINGLPSWGHYYPWHYPPLMSDLYVALIATPFDELSKFELGRPSLPFVQLLSVLPPRSANLLSMPFRRLMLDANSPLVRAGTYPSSFKIDYEGKTKKHFGISILNFADVKLVERCYQRMMDIVARGKTIQEVVGMYPRNKLGRAITLRYSPSASDERYTNKYGVVDVKIVVGNL
jgi:5'-3' exoribonuclease 1